MQDLYTYGRIHRYIVTATITHKGYIIINTELLHIDLMAFRHLHVAINWVWLKKIIFFMSVQTLKTIRFYLACKQHFDLLRNRIEKRSLSNGMITYHATQTESVRWLLRLSNLVGILITISYYKLSTQLLTPIPALRTVKLW